MFHVNCSKDIIKNAQKSVARARNSRFNRHVPNYRARVELVLRPNCRSFIYDTARTGQVGDLFCPCDFCARVVIRRPGFTDRLTFRSARKYCVPRTRSFVILQALCLREMELHLCVQKIFLPSLFFILSRSLEESVLTILSFLLFIFRTRAYKI